MEEGTTVNHIPKTFRERLEDFLKSRVEKERYMTEFAKEQEESYQEAYKYRQRLENSECVRKLQYLDTRMTQVRPQMGQEVRVREDKWLFFAKARCCLLLATFYQEESIFLKLENFRIQARSWNEQDGLEDFESEDMTEIEVLCLEMRNRLIVEEAKGMFPLGQLYRDRMTDDWLERTKRASRPGTTTL
ncbi:MAG: hypothetical protein Q9182_001066 [Xanthomendoza sp. 2 TL-2023]